MADTPSGGRPRSGVQRIGRRVAACLVAAMTAATVTGVVVAPAARALPLPPKEIGGLGGGSTVAHAANDAGVIVGESWIPTFDPVFQENPYHFSHAFRRDPVTKKLTDLTTLGGADPRTNAQARDINNAGLVVGRSEESNNSYLPARAAIWDPVTGFAFIGAPAVASQANAVNDAGVVAGQEDGHAVVWNVPAATKTDLHTLLALADGWVSSAVAVNGDGKVAGTIRPPNGLLDDRVFGFTWHPVEGMAVDTVDDHLEPADLNSDTLVGTDNARAFRWNTLTGKAVIPMPGATGFDSRATAVNDAGQVVGRYALTANLSAWQGFLWDPSTGAQDLTSPSLSRPVDINNNGVVVFSTLAELWGGSSVGPFGSKAYVTDMTPDVFDTVSVTVSGGYSYANSANLDGDLAVSRNTNGTIRSVSGAGTIPSTVSGSATVAFNVSQFWILPVYSGQVLLSDPAAHLGLNTPVFFTAVNSVSNNGASATNAWISFSPWPPRGYTLNWTVHDLY